MSHSIIGPNDLRPKLESLSTKQIGFQNIGSVIVDKMLTHVEICRDYVDMYKHVDMCRHHVETYETMLSLRQSSI